MERLPLPYTEQFQVSAKTALIQSQPQAPAYHEEAGVPVPEASLAPAPSQAVAPALLQRLSEGHAAALHALEHMGTVFPVLPGGQDSTDQGTTRWKTNRRVHAGLC